jgi:hypothetical protein
MLIVIKYINLAPPLCDNCNLINSCVFKVTSLGQDRFLPISAPLYGRDLLQLFSFLHFTYRRFGLTKNDLRKLNYQLEDKIKLSHGFNVENKINWSSLAQRFSKLPS